MGLTTRLTRSAMTIALGVAALTGASGLGSSVAGAAPRSITLSEASKGHLYYLYPGDKVTVVLHSTYWSFTPLSGPAYIAQVGSVQTKMVPPGTSGCVPGQGCGTVTVHFVAKALGAVRVSASRTSCGEALRCTPANSHWSVIFKVY